jgi:hypothetical protein
MKCKLCLEEKKLINTSHIIPSFMYKELLAGEINFVKGDLKSAKSKNIQTGEFEGGILCKDCEGRIAQWEHYANAFLYGSQLKEMGTVDMQNFKNVHGVEYTQVKGINYSKLKLFFLSVLWRASISTRPLFKNVSLGSYEEKIRFMLHSEDPGKEHTYPCLLQDYRKTGLPYQIIGEPLKIEKEGVRYHFLICGVLYTFLISHKVHKKWVLESILRENGEMKIIRIPEKNAKLLLNKFFGKELFA